MKPNDLSGAPWIKGRTPIAHVHAWGDLSKGHWTLRAVVWDGKSVRCDVYRFGLQNLKKEQAEKLVEKVRAKGSINLIYWKREPHSPYASDML